MSEDRSEITKTVSTVEVVEDSGNPSNLDNAPRSFYNSKVYSWIRRSTSTSPSLDLIKTGTVLLLALFVGTSVANSLKLTFFASRTHPSLSKSAVIERLNVGTRVQVRRSLAYLNWEYLHRSKVIVIQVPNTLPLTGSSTTMPHYNPAPVVATSGNPSSNTVPTTSVPMTTTSTAAPPQPTTPLPTIPPTTQVKVIPPKSPKEPKPVKVIPPKSPKEPKVSKGDSAQVSQGT